MSLGSKITESENGGDSFGAVCEGDGQFIDDRGIFTPEYRMLSQIICHRIYCFSCRKWNFKGLDRGDLIFESVTVTKL